MKGSDYPTLEALQPWARRAFEDAYRRRQREQASREDIAYGFIAALCWARVSSAFLSDTPTHADLEILPSQQASDNDHTRR